MEPKPEINPNFTIEDIHKIREYWLWLLNSPLNKMPKLRYQNEMNIDVKRQV